MTIGRRAFLRGTALSGGGLLLAWYPGTDALAQPRAAQPAAPLLPGAFIRVAPDGVYTTRGVIKRIFLRILPR